MAAGCPSQPERREGAIVMAKERLDRREFTSQAVLALLSGVAITITGCGTDNPAAPRVPPAPPVTDVTGVIANNHGHVAVITAAQQTGGAAVSVDLRGASSHTHQVELSLNDVLSIRAGAQVVKQSTGTGHTHTVTFN
jgi:hypothetical protein